MVNSDDSKPAYGQQSLPVGYGAAVATNGLGQELWRYLICERCGALIANESRYVQLHDKFHGG